MNILAIDLGTQLGWALTKRDGSVHSGTFNFSPAQHGGHGGKFLAFMKRLNEIRDAHGEVHAVYYEDIKMHKGVLAAHAYGGFLAILQTWSHINRAPLYGVGFGAIKKNWTGRGNADKVAMIAAARQRGFSPTDDNEADALAILALACIEEGRQFPQPSAKPEGTLL